ncbi:DcuC family C4-dicarboxylate transporter [Sporomusaceae bacterium BoRhaA]|uniref:C4-dicarboxylate transporter DcuC n=1 Tax=Pelorhabdus rhamnosifermentans TaxID=2772457 RepID=UPI001C05F917|nr:C4-dicarboxylate transporter DcuC [Pelorhabdus rhamnosifermentans]MBU2700015.1 DcuC family C4-dicarboxylate transporter [Pelorhabdus rhamnosifermentans]
MGSMITILVVAWVIYMIIKKYYPQAVLLTAGIILLLATYFMGTNPILAAKESSGSALLDIFHTIKVLLSSRVAGLGLTIMSIAGFAKYMEYIGASKSLFAVVASPIKHIKSPYLLLVLSFFVSQFLVLFIPSHAGLALLLMVTMYPVLIRAGVSKMSALGVIGCAQYMDVGPGSGNEILAANICKVDPAVFFVEYQLPIFVTTTLILGIVHYFVQKWWDKKEGFVGYDDSAELVKEDNSRPPLIYAILPIIPMIFILGFSPIFKSKIQMDVVTAMFLSTFISMIFEYIRTKDFRSTLQSLKYLYEGMGNSFATVVSLIVAGEVFAAGLMKIGAVDAMTAGAQNLGLGIQALIILFCIVIACCAFLMGSGNAAFFSFAALAPKIAAALKIDVVILLLPMQIMTSFGRVVSPITAAIVAIAGVAGVSPVQVVKRTAIPMAFAAIVNVAFILIKS